MAIQLEFQSNSKKTQDDLEKLRQSVEGINKSVNNTSASLRNFATNIAITIGSLATTGVITTTIDSLTRLDSKLKLATSSIADYNKALRYTRDVSLSTRAPLNDIATLYQKISMNSEDLKATQTDIAVVTQTVAKSLAVSNATAAETTAVILQLGQALAAGVLRGDELRSVMEGAPALANALAKGLGVSVGQMKILGEQGKLTSRDVFQALLRSTTLINDQFSKVGITYSQAFTNIGNAILLLLGSINKAFNSKASAPAIFINNLAIGIAKFANDLDNILLKSKLKLVFFVNDVIEAFTALPALVSDKIKLLLNTFNQVFDITLNIKKLNIKDFFSDLQPVTDIVSKWVHTIEGYFFWLYDKVIGHSWIPDLVQGVINWVEKLKGAPVSAIRSFASASGEAFSNLNKSVAQKLVSKFSLTAVVLSAAGALEATLGKTFAKIIINGFLIAFSSISVLGLIGAIINASSDKSILGSLTNKLESIYNSLSDSTKSVTEKLKGFLNSSYNKLLSFLSSLSITNKLKDWWNKSMFGYNARQVLGMKETYYNKDPNDYVGRGPLRDRPNRPPLHDIINALPTTWQVPALVGLGSVVALAIVSIFQAGTFRSALLSILTTVVGYGMARLVDKKVVSEFTNDLAWGVLKAVQQGIKAVFSFAGDTGFKDPFGFLSLIFKLSLLFAAGRDFAKNVAIGAATAPSRAVNAIGTRIEQRNVAKALDNVQTRLVENQSRMAQLENRANSVFSRNGNNPALWSAINNLTRSVNTRGQTLNRDQINRIIIDRQIQWDPNSSRSNRIASQRALADSLPKDFKFSGSMLRDTGVLIRELRNSSRDQQNAVMRFNSGLISAMNERANLNANREALDRSNKGLIKQVETTARDFKVGILNTASAIGGVFGTYAGLNIGEKIAEGMVGYPSWAKIGVTIGSAIFGQAVLAGFFRGVSAFLLGIGTTILSVISPIGVIIAGAISAALFFILNPKAWTAVQAVLQDAILIFEPILKEWWGALKKWWSETAGSLEWWYKVGQQIQAGITSFNNNIIDPIREKYPVYDKAIIKTTDLLDSLLNNSSTDKVPANQPFMATEDMQQWWANNKSPRGPLDSYSQAQEEASARRGVFYNRLFEGFKEYVLSPIGEFITDFISYRPTQNKASGGMIYGPGSGTSDSIPAMLSNGEFVVNAKSTRKNRKLLENINNGLLPQFATGGLVSFNGDTIVGDKSAILEYDNLFKKMSTPYYEDQVYRKYGDQNAKKYPKLIKENINKLPNKLVKDDAFKKTLQDHIDTLISARGGVKNLLSEDETLLAKMNIVEGNIFIPDIFNNKYPDMAYGISLHEIGHLDDVTRNGWKGVPSFKDIIENTTAKERNIVERLREKRMPDTQPNPVPMPEPPTSWLPSIIRSMLDKPSTKSIDTYDWKTHIEALNKDTPERFNKIYPYLDRYDNNLVAAMNMTNKGRFASEQYANEFAYINSKIKSKEFFSSLSLSMRTYIRQLDAEDQMKVDATTYNKAIELSLGKENKGEIIFPERIPSYNELIDSSVGNKRILLDSGKINLFNMKEISNGEGQISNMSWEFSKLINKNKNSILDNPYYDEATNNLDWKEKSKFINMYYDATRDILKKIYTISEDLNIPKLYRETWDKLFEETAFQFNKNMSVKDFPNGSSEKLVGIAKKYFPLMGYASGGIIQGSGSGTSDSILARVSNGEFIVNAQSTKKNRALLDLINSNQMPRFAEGTPSVTNTKETLDNIAKALKDDNERLKVFLDLLTRMEGVKFGFNTGYGNKQIEDLSNHPYPSNYLGIKTGLPATNEEARMGMTTSAAGAWQFQRGTWDIYAKKLGLTDFSGDSQTKVATEIIKDWNAMTDVISGNFSIALDKLSKVWASAPGSMANQPKKTWDQVVNLAKESKNSVEKGTSILVKNTQEVTTSIGKFIQELVKDLQGISSITDVKQLLMKYANKFNSDNPDTKSFTEDVMPRNSYIKSFEDLAKDINALTEPVIGLTISAETLNRLNESQISTLESYVDALREAEKKLLIAKGKGDLSGEFFARISKDAKVNTLKDFLKSTEPANLSFKDKLDKLKTSEESFNYINSYLEKLYGTTLTVNQFKNTDNTKMIDNIVYYLNELDRLNKVINNPETGSYQRQFNQSAALDTKNAIEKILKEIQTSASATLRKAGLSQEAAQAGIAYASTFENELSTVVSNVIKGKIKGKDALLAMADSFSSSIIDNLAKSFVTNMMKNSGLDNIISTIIGGVYDLGGGISKELFRPKEIPKVTSDDPLNLSATNLNGSANALNTAGTQLSSAATQLMTAGVPKSGQGGWISGNELPSGSDLSVPNVMDNSGYGRPDMVPSDLTSGKEGIASNATMTGVGMMIGTSLTALGAMIGGKAGQIISILGMVVNAIMMVAMISALPGAKGMVFSTSGQLSTFAKGGIFSSPHLFPMANNGIGLLGEAGPEAIMPLTRLPGGKLGVKAVGGNQPNNAVFNISITGDVSRQTRSEIQRMIPQIASGVNQHNYEQGYYRK